MHSERQFVQSPSFNAVFYDIPPKLMSYYTALIHSIIDIAGTSDKNEKYIYSFVLRPSFRRDLGILPYSLEVDPPTDRLLSVYVNEKVLYRPANFIQIMCHEVAHYVDNGTNKKRDVRKNYWLRSILYSLLVGYITDVLGKSEPKDKMLLFCIKELQELIFEKLEISKQKEIYSDNFKKLLLDSISIIREDEELSAVLVKFFINSDLSQDSGILAGFDINATLRKFKTYLVFIEKYMFYEGEEFIGNLRDRILQEYSDLKYFFTEAYADLQMIKILELTLVEYLSSFIINEKEHGNLREYRIDAYYRIFVIVYYMHKKSNWNIVEAYKQTEENEVKELMKYLMGDMDYINVEIDNDEKELPEFSEELKAEIIKCKDNLYLHNYWVANMLAYLDKVCKASEEHYESQEVKVKLEELRKNYKCIKEFDDVIEVAQNVQNVNREYAEILFSTKSV